jgi:hypothetical protein
MIKETFPWQPNDPLIAAVWNSFQKIAANLAGNDFLPAWKGTPMGSGYPAAF